MPNYEYYTIPILPAAGTNVVANLPLFGVYMDKTFNGAGNFNGSYYLDTGRYDDSLLLGGTIPGFHAMVVKRNDVFIWSGVIWSRTYASESKTVQLSGQTFESIFQYLALTSDFIKSSVEQVTIFGDMITALQAQTNCNFGLSLTPALGATGVTRSLTIPGAENHLAADVLTQLVEANNGLSYTVNLSGAGNAPNRDIRLFNNAAAAISSGMVFDYPGTITKYWYTENASRGGVRHVAQGPSRLYQAVNNADLIAANWPAWLDLAQFPEIGNTALLTAKATKMSVENKAPVPSPTYELGESSLFSGWNDLGKTVTTNVTDPRFPTGQTITSQMTGWSLSPAASDTPEVIRLTLAGDS